MKNIEEFEKNEFKTEKNKIKLENKFIKLSEMTKEDILKLPKLEVKISSKMYDGVYKPNYIVLLHDYFQKQVSYGDAALTANEYILHCMKFKRKPDVKEKNVFLPYRAVTGIKDDRRWYRLDIFFGGTIVKSLFLNNADVLLLKDIEKNYNFSVVFIEAPLNLENDELLTEETF